MGSSLFTIEAAMVLRLRFRFPSLYQLQTLHNTIRVQQYMRCRNSLYPSKLWSRSFCVTAIFNQTSETSSLKPISSVRSIIDNRNVFRSPYEDVDIPSEYMHQYVWKNVDQWWDSTALECAQTGKSYTYGELRKLSGRFATSLRKNKWLPGTMLAVVLPNVPEYAIIVLGASEAGVQLALINPAYTANEMKKQLDSSEARAVITNKMIYSTVMDSMRLGNESTPMPVIVVSDGPDVPSNSLNFEDLIADGIEEFAKTGEQLTVNPEIHTLLLPYSSGTTGPPKGTEITHRNLVAAISMGLHPETALVEPTCNGVQNIVPLILPLYHIYGMVIGFLSCLRIGVKLICMPQFTSNHLLDVLEKHRITAMFAVPPIIQLLAMDPKFSKKHVMDLKVLVSGGAPLTPEFVARFQVKMGEHIECLQGCGLTETTAMMTCATKSPVGSTGFVQPNTEIRVVHRGDNGDRNLGVNEIGEFFVKGPQIMKGYFKNAEATQDSMDGEWFKTGDLGYINDKGYLFITGRSKELIKVQGSQVSPTELETIIHSHEKVADAAVIGVPHEKFGEVPKAFVVPKIGVTITEEEIKDFVAKQVVKYKQVVYVVFTDRIIKSPAGKILRKELQKL